MICLNLVLIGMICFHLRNGREGSVGKWRVILSLFLLMFGLFRY